MFCLLSLLKIFTAHSFKNLEKFEAVECDLVKNANSLHNNDRHLEKKTPPFPASRNILTEKMFIRRKMVSSLDPTGLYTCILVYRLPIAKQQGFLPRFRPLHWRKKLKNTRFCFFFQKCL